MRSADRKWQVASGWWLVDEGNGDRFQTTPDNYLAAL